MHTDWTSYKYQRAPRVLCEFLRDGKTFIANPKDFSPEFNIAGLRWRLTGIGKHELDSMSPECRAQMMPPAFPMGLLGNLLY